MEDIIDIIVTETTNTIEITAQPNDEIIDVNIIDNREDVTLNVTPTVVEININSLTGNFGILWGEIEGTLSNQTDLQNVLNLKADLVDGKVPSSQLPSYVDDVVEVANYAALPATGEVGKIYITLDTNFIYRWTGSTYVEIKDSSAVWGAITGTLSNQTDLQNALNAKDAVLTFSSPLSRSTNTVSIPAATTSVNGYLTSTDWTTFNAKQPALSGTGFVKISGTTISYDNSTYLTTSAAASTYLALAGGTLTGALNGTSATFTGDLTLSSTNPRLYFTDTDNNPDYFISNTDGTFTVYDVTNSTSRFTIGTTGNGTFGGNLTVGQIIRSGGTSSQFLKADGSVDSSTYLTTASAASTYLPLAGGTLTGAVSGTRLTLSQNSADITLSIGNAGTGRAFSVLGTSYFSTDIQLGYATNAILKTTALGFITSAIAGTDYQAPLSGTGFVKISGSTISYDNSTYALDSAVVKLTGAQTVAGVKTMSNVFKLDDTLQIKNIAQLSNSTGYTGIWAETAAIGFYTGANAIRLLYAGNYNYTMPASDGTLALTSQLSAYLPLAGGTLTGALNGTSALFSGAVRANNPSEGATGEGLIAGQSFKIDGTGTSQKAVMYMVSNVLSDTYASGLTAQYANFAGDKAFGFNLNTSGGFELYVKNTTFNKAITVANTGAVTLTSALSGTSATFSGLITSTVGNNSSILYNATATTGYIVGVDILNTSGRTQIIQEGSTAGTTVTGSTAYATLFGSARNNLDVQLFTNATVRMTLNGSTGAATFSNSITAPSGINAVGQQRAYSWQRTTGTPSDVYSLNADSGSAYLQNDTTSGILMTWLEGGNVGIGTTAPSGASGLALAINGGTNQTRIALKNSTTGDAAGNGLQILLDAGSLDAAIENRENGHLRFATGGSERMRITSGGFLKQRANGGAYFGGSYNEIVNNNNTNGDICLVIGNKQGSNTNNTSSYLLIASDAGSDRMYIYGNGNIVNINGSYGTLSDATLKENIVDATPKLDDILQLKVRNFNLIGDSNKQIGFVAQEFEEVFPSMIDIDGKSGKKAIKTSVLVPMLVKAVQELKAELDNLKNK